MPGDFIRRLPQFSFETFDAFRNDRPKEEKWELIDGVPVMMPPPSLVHQRIASNVWLMLHNTLQKVRPDWRADLEIGVLLSDDENYNPEPDVTVIDEAIGLDQFYAGRFYFVAEVLSASDRPDRRAGSDEPAALGAKIGYYQRHAHCRGVLIVRQDVVEADLHIRTLTGWTRHETSCVNH